MKVCGLCYEPLGTDDSFLCGHPGLSGKPVVTCQLCGIKLALGNSGTCENRSGRKVCGGTESDGFIFKCNTGHFVEKNWDYCPVCHENWREDDLRKEAQKDDKRGKETSEDRGLPFVSTPLTVLRKEFKRSSYAPTQLAPSSLLDARRPPSQPPPAGGNVSISDVVAKNIDIDASSSSGSGGQVNVNDAVAQQINIDASSSTTTAASATGIPASGGVNISEVVTKNLTVHAGTTIYSGEQITPAELEELPDSHSEFPAYWASDKKTQTAIVLKKCPIVTPELTRFVNEELQFAKIRDGFAGMAGHIARYRGVEMIAGEQYLVRDYSGGRSLRHRIRRDGPLSDQNVLKLLSTIAQVLRVLNKFGHGSISPDNIYLEDSDDELRANIVDVGIWRVKKFFAERLADQGSEVTPLFSPNYSDQELVAVDIKAVGELGIHALGAEDHLPMNFGSYYLKFNKQPYDRLVDACQRAIEGRIQGTLNLLNAMNSIVIPTGRGTPATIALGSDDDDWDAGPMIL